MKYSSLKTENPLHLEDGVSSDGPVDCSCIYTSKYDVATYREKAPHLSYGEKDWIKNVCAWKKLLLCGNNKIFYIWVATVVSLALLFFQWWCILLLLSCVMFGHDFSTKAS